MSTLAPGLIAGAVGALMLTLYLVGTALHQVDLGLVFATFAIAAGWGVGYAYLAARTPQLVKRPLVSGIVFGLFVILMPAVFLTGGKVATGPSLAEGGRQTIGYAFFYGVPLGYITARRMRPA